MFLSRNCNALSGFACAPVTLWKCGWDADLQK